MIRVVIIADDLTGALDSACAFAARGLRTCVTLGAAEFRAAMARDGNRVVAYVSGSRERPEAEAVQKIIDIIPSINRFDGIVFKKIDSRLKGHVAAELAPLREVFRRPVLAAPAVPALGRIVRGGCVTGAGVDAPIAVAPVLGGPALIPDTGAESDLDAALPARVEENLYVGAAGLGAALARRIAGDGKSPRLHLPQPMLLAIGSRDPVTLAQIGAAPLQPVAAPNGAVPPLNSRSTALVRLTAGAEAIGTIEAAQRFAADIAREVRRTAPASLFACGGETAHAILHALDIHALELLGEVLPGVPVARCPVSGMIVVTKSGGFGKVGLLADLLKKFANAPANGVTTS